jgi:hypothetical protein
VHIDDEIAKIDIATNLANISTQQQIAKIAEVINDVRSRVISLQEGHDDDLFGSIKGMHQQLLQILDAKNSDSRRQLATNAITVLNETRGKLEVAIVNTVKGIRLVPNTDRAILWEIAKDKNFLSDTVEKYDRIEELLGYYVTATQLLAYFYAFLDESVSFTDIFTPSRDLLENENLQKLSAAENLFIQDLVDNWYKNPERFLLKIENASHCLFAESGDIVDVEIEITGKNLLEAIKYGKKSNNENENIRTIPQITLSLLNMEKSQMMRTVKKRFQLANKGINFVKDVSPKAVTLGMGVAIGKLWREINRKN